MSAAGSLERRAYTVSKDGSSMRTASVSTPEYGKGDNVIVRFFDDVCFTNTVRSVVDGTALLERDGIVCGSVGADGNGARVSYHDVDAGLFYTVANNETTMRVAETDAAPVVCGGERTPDPEKVAAMSQSAAEASESEASAADASATPVRAESSSSSLPTIDILFVFDANAAPYVQNKGYTIDSYAQMQIERMNTVLANNSLNEVFSYRKVGVMTVNASSNHVYAVDLFSEAYCRDSSSPWYPIQVQKKALKADIALCFVCTGSEYGTTGVAWGLNNEPISDFRAWGYACCSVENSVSSYVTAHEVGHVLGCGHSNIQSYVDANGDSNNGPQFTSPLKPYSCGYHIKNSRGGGVYHTVMAYNYDKDKNPYTQIPYYSDPTKSYNGYTVGTAENNDNARVLRETAEQCSMWYVNPEADESGETPYVWIKFDGGIADYGSAALSFGEAGAYTTNFVATHSGKAMLTVNGSLHPWANMSPSGAFTVASCLRSVASSNSVLFCLGNVNSGGLALISGGGNRVMLTYHDGNSAYEVLESVSVENATEQFHHYAIVSDASNNIRFYVDGVRQGGTWQRSIDRNLQIGGVHGGLGSNTGYQRVSGVAVDDWRYYTSAKSDSEVLALASAHPPWPSFGAADEIGLRPAHWYKFDGNMENSGAAECFSGENDSSVYAANAAVTSNGMALVTVSGSLHPYGTITNSSEFAIATSLKSVATTNAVLLSVGHVTSDGVALVAASENTVNFVLYTNGVNQGSWPMAIANAESQYHHYVLNCKAVDDGRMKYTVYVDGSVAHVAGTSSEMVFTRALANRQVQIGGLLGNAYGCGLTRVSGVAVDDFRVYARSLTAEQISSLAGYFPPWPTGGIYLADISGDVTWSTQGGLANKTGFLSNDGTTAVSLKNAVSSSVVDFDAQTSLASLSLSGSGAVELKGTADVPSLTVADGSLSELSLRDGFASGSSLTLPSALTLRHVGTTAMSGFPYETDATPCLVSVERPYTNETLLIGSNSGTPHVQNFRVADGADINAGRFILGNGGNKTNRGTATLEQTGGTLTVTGGEEGTNTNASVMFGHWPCTTTYTLSGGSFNAQDAVARIGWDGDVTVTVGGGSGNATFTARGIRSGLDERSRSASVSVLTNGTLALGSSGVAFGSTSSLTLAGGTLAFTSAQTENSIAGGVTLAADSAISAKDGARLDFPVNGTSTLAIEGEGAVTFAPGEGCAIGGLSAGSGITELSLENTVLTNAAISVANSSAILRYTGTETLSAFPYERLATPCLVSVERPYVSSETLMLGSCGNDPVVQNFRVADGAEISLDGFHLGNGGYSDGKGTTRLSQTGGSISVSGSGDATSTSTSVIFGHWPCNTTYDLTGGSFTASNAVVRCGWDGEVDLTVGGGTEEARFTALGLRGATDGKTTRAAVSVLTNGTLSLGSSGIAFGSNATLTLAGGTLEFTDAATTNLDATIAVTAPSVVKTAAVRDGAPRSGETLVLFNVDESAANLITVVGSDGTPLSSRWIVAFDNGKLVCRENILPFTANITDANVTWSTGAGLSDASCAWAESDGTATLTNNVAESVVTFDADFSASSLAIAGTGKVTLTPMAGFELANLVVGEGITDLTLYGTMLDGVEMTFEDAETVLHYAGTEALTSFPFTSVSTPCVVSIERSYSNTSEDFHLGSSGNTAISQHFRIADGVSIEVDRFRTATGTGNTTTIDQLGGTVSALSSYNSEAEHTGSAINIGHWNATAVYNLTGGSLLATNGQIRLGWDSDVTMNVGGGTEQSKMSAVGYRMGNSKNKSVTLNVLTNGLVEAGASGIIAESSDAAINLAGGRIYCTATNAIEARVDVTAPGSTMVIPFDYLDKGVLKEDVKLFNTTQSLDVIASRLSVKTPDWYDPSGIQAELAVENGGLWLKRKGYVCRYETGDGWTDVTIPADSAQAWASENDVVLSEAFADGAKGANGLDNMVNCILGLSPESAEVPLTCSIALENGGITVSAGEDFKPIESVVVTLSLEAAASPDASDDGWTEVQAQPFNAEGVSFSFTPSSTDKAQFYRIRVKLANNPT